MKIILLVEDESFILDVYATGLRKEGYRVEIAPNAKMALEKIMKDYPDLLILDLDLPKTPGAELTKHYGLELLKIIRNDPKAQNLKVVILSNYNIKDYAEEISGLGVLRCFLKVETHAEDIIKFIKETLK